MYFRTIKMDGSFVPLNFFYHLLGNAYLTLYLRIQMCRKSSRKSGNSEPVQARRDLFVPHIPRHMPKSILHCDVYYPAIPMLAPPARSDKTHVIPQMPPLMHENMPPPSYEMATAFYRK